jgi:hypothetical protein
LSAKRQKPASNVKKPRAQNVQPFGTQNFQFP